MSRVCDVTGKRPEAGNNRSHANNSTRRVFKPNVHKKSFALSTGQVVKLKVSAHGLRIINKLGIDRVWSSIQERRQTQS